MFNSDDFAPSARDGGSSLHMPTSVPDFRVTSLLGSTRGSLVVKCTNTLLQRDFVVQLVRPTSARVLSAGIDKIRFPNLARFFDLWVEPEMPDTIRRLLADSADPFALSWLSSSERLMCCQHESFGSLLADALLFLDVSASQRLSWVQQLEAAVQHLHNNNVVHGDISVNTIYVRGDELKLAPSCYCPSEHASKKEDIKALHETSQLILGEFPGLFPSSDSTDSLLSTPTTLSSRLDRLDWNTYGCDCHSPLTPDMCPDANDSFAVGSAPSTTGSARCEPCFASAEYMGCLDHFINPASIANSSDEDIALALQFEIEQLEATLKATDASIAAERALIHSYLISPTF